ncbi:hypothetical protein [Pseudaminobacter sp. NGMCC 1.201702]|uniref:hypothetical protein n=1 Tax=Pseudaminobacter sp. NGMCC 1.201702 TaxID=3391825 RepID=UPI0039F07170
MKHTIDDCSKPRLTEPVDILTAVNILRSWGLDHEEMICEITRWFYVDLDAFNEVVRSSH